MKKKQILNAFGLYSFGALLNLQQFFLDNNQPNHPIRLPVFLALNIRDIAADHTLQFLAKALNDVNDPQFGTPL
jgi:hypothetical protein